MRGLEKHGEEAFAQKTAQTLHKFWTAIRSLMDDTPVFKKYDPDDHETSANGAYNLQKQIGVMTMHIILDEIGEMLNRRPESLALREFETILNVDEVTNPKHWKVKTGKWTKHGTNYKSFGEIAADILKAIEGNPDIKNLVR